MMRALRFGWLFLVVLFASLMRSALWFVRMAAFAVGALVLFAATAFALVTDKTQVFAAVDVPHVTSVILTRNVANGALLDWQLNVAAAPGPANMAPEVGFATGTLTSGQSTTAINLIKNVMLPIYCAKYGLMCAP